ncbi:MAG: biopolymer transporter ExbD [Thermodesulfobacteriota bacterium]
MMRQRISRRVSDTPELDITTFLNLMVVLIPFLLISAVFSRVAIMELTVPTGGGPGAPKTPQFTIEVIVRSNGMELGNGSQVIAAIAKKDDKYDMQQLSELLVRLKGDYPEKEDATILMEPDIEYNYLIKVMDVLRSVDVKLPDSEEIEKLPLFPSISIGDAP